MPSSDECTADDIRNLASNVNNASRMVQRVITAIKKQKTVKSIGVPLCGKCRQNAEKFDEEKLCKEEEQQKRKDRRLAEKSAEKAKKSVQKV